MSGSISPFAAAAIGFCGINEVSHVPNPVAPPDAPIWPAASAAPAGSGGRGDDVGGSIANTVTMVGTATRATHATCAVKITSVRPPMRPTDVTLVVEAIPVISSETTSGITVIRMALTQRMPIGITRSAACRSDVLPDAAIAAPAMSATTSAMRTVTALFMVERYIMRSPPLISSDVPVM